MSVKGIFIYFFFLIYSLIYLFFFFSEQMELLWAQKIRETLDSCIIDGSEMEASFET